MCCNFILAVFMTCLKIYNLRDESAGNKVCSGTVTNCFLILSSNCMYESLYFAKF